jgi:hypothetical protein
MQGEQFSHSGQTILSAVDSVLRTVSTKELQDRAEASGAKHGLGSWQVGVTALLPNTRDQGDDEEEQPWK